MTRTYTDKFSAKKSFLKKLAIVLSDPSGRKLEMQEHSELQGEADNPLAVMWKEIREMKEMLGVSKFPTQAEVEEALRWII